MGTYLLNLALPKGNMVGLWIAGDESQKPDLVIYYCHGMIHIYLFL